MITYKNISFSAKTFYGVKFNPGDVKSVPGYINSSGMVRIFGVKPELNKAPIYEVPTESTRGRKKKTSEPEKASVAETPETKIETQEETSNGN